MTMRTLIIHFLRNISYITSIEDFIVHLMEQKNLRTIIVRHKVDKVK